MTAFNGHMLTLARTLRKFSQAGLVEKVKELGGEMSQAMLSKIERGRIQPEEDLALFLADALRVRKSFFENPSYVRQPPISYHRKRTKLSARDLQSIHAVAEMIRLSLEKCFEALDEFDHLGPSIPSYDLDQFDGDAEEAARAVRARLRLPRGPLKNLASLMEASGVIVCQFNFGNTLIDGFCQHSHAGLPSVVFMNTQLPVDRFRFSLAHELGHLVCHDAPNPEQEIQANHFASEFLMPTSDIYDDLRDMTLSKAMELKLYWGTSMQSIIQKAWKTGRISDQRRKNLFIELSRRGWRKSEPVEASGFVESTSTFSNILKAHLDELDFSLDELSEHFGITREYLDAYYPIERSRPSLRIVASN